MEKFTKGQLAYGWRLLLLGVPMTIVLMAMPYTTDYSPEKPDHDLLWSSFVWAETEEGWWFWAGVNDEFIDSLED